MKDQKFVQKVLSGGALISLIMLGAAVAIGIATGNFWVGAGIWFSLAITVWTTAYYVVIDDFKIYSWTWVNFFVLLFLYAKYGQFGRGWWITTWVLAALAHGLVSTHALQRNKPFHSMVADAFTVSSIITIFSKPSDVANLLVRMKLMSINNFGDTALPAAHPAALPAASTNFWMWVLLISGFFSLVGAWFQGYVKTEGKPFIALASIGVGLLAFATWLSAFRGGWWWALAWGLAALMLAHAAHELREYYEADAAGFGTFLVILCLLIGIGGPYAAGRGWLAKPVTEAIVSTPTFAVTERTPAPIPTATVTLTSQPQVTPTPSAPQTGQNTARSLTAVQQFLLTAVKSIWGIFHLLMLLLLGYSWFKNGWGSLMPLSAVLIVVWLAGNNPASTVDETLIHLISSSPAGWMRDLLRFSAERWGHTGWGILLLGIVVSLVMFPAQRQLIVSRYKLKNLPFVQRLFSTTIAYEYMKGATNPTLMAVNTLINPIVQLGLFIALWIALRQASNTGDIPLAAWSIPDLSVPNWKPVWQWPYFAVAGVLALVQIALIPIKRKFNVLVSGLDSEINIWHILIGTFVVALFVPAGVMIFLIAQSACQLLPVPLAGQEIARLEAEERKRQEEERKRLEERRRREEAAREAKRKEQERQRVAQVQPVAPPRPALASENHPFYQLKTKPAGLVVQSDLTLAVLSTQGMLFLCKGNDVRKTSLNIPDAIALLSLKDDNLLALTEQQALFLSPEGKLMRTLTFSTPAKVVALNPYKTMLAYLSADSKQGRAVFLEAGREVEIAKDLPLGNALAFSRDGRELAVASDSSILHVFDISTRQKVAELRDPASGETGATLLSASPHRSWFVVYGKKRVVRLSKEKGLELSVGSRTNILSLRLWDEQERIILGCQNGSVRILDLNFETLFDQKICEEPIISVIHYTPTEVVALTPQGDLWKVKV